MLRLICHRYARIAPIPGITPGSQKIIFVDPPYNIGVKYEDDPSGDRMESSSYQLWTSSVLVTLSPYLMPGGTLWWMCPASHMDWISPRLSENIGPIKYRIVKRETFAQYQQKSLTEDYRMLYCCVKPGGQLTFNPDTIRVQSERQKIGDKRADPRGRVPGQVWDIRRLQGTANDHVDWHKAQLPPELLSRIVLGFSNEGDETMDAFAGSGSMGLVCKALKRNWTGVDGSPTYIRKMAERIGIKI